MTSPALPRISDDLYRLTGRRSKAALLKRFLLDRAFRPLVTLRLGRGLRARNAPAALFLPLKLLHAHFCHAAQLELPLGTEIGPALQIAHGFGIVVNGKARMGANITLFHGVTIGQGDRIDADGTRVTGYPVIEDEVWIGPHAIVAGGITVGAGSRIMPGAVVTTDIPPGSMVAGNPGAIIREKCQPDVLHRVDVRAADGHAEARSPAALSREPVPSPRPEAA